MPRTPAKASGKRAATESTVPDCPGCEKRCVKKTSASDKNPGRDYYGCEVVLAQLDCKGFLKWVNETPKERAIRKSMADYAIKKKAKLEEFGLPDEDTNNNNTKTSNSELSKITAELKSVKDELNQFITDRGLREDDGDTPGFGRL